MDILNFEKYNDCDILFEPILTKALGFSNGFIRGDVITIGAKRALFTLISYEKGWKAYVNGVLQDIPPLVDDTHIGLDILQAGYYEIELRFREPGYVVEIVISCLRMLIFLPINVLEELNLKKN